MQQEFLTHSRLLVKKVLILRCPCARARLPSLGFVVVVVDVDGVEVGAEVGVVFVFVLGLVFEMTKRRGEGSGACAARGVSGRVHRRRARAGGRLADTSTTTYIKPDLPGGRLLGFGLAAGSGLTTAATPLGAGGGGIVLT